MISYKKNLWNPFPIMICKMSAFLPRELTECLRLQKTNNSIEINY